MTNAIVVTGTLTDPQTVKLDEPLSVGGKVKLVVEPLTPEPPKAPTSLDDFLAGLRDRQQARGHVPMSREEIDAHVRAERESWE